ncbi:MAG: MmcQ/YjbR family DNA-binding protein [Cyclobacteriaceae bacterium]|nr:MmcQ/YjbR family DNA-binding protein [Cyclobacteriaceae bacterium]
MVTPAEAIAWALELPEAEQQPHVNKTSFRVRKRIFATLDMVTQHLVVKLNEVDQSIFTAGNATVIYPVAGAWGKKGWTQIELSKVRKSICHDALQTSYCLVAPQKLAQQVRQIE